jgi:antitoxin VapB
MDQPEMKSAASMSEGATARLFRDGRSQAVRLPQEFRFRGDRVRVRRMGQGVLLEPVPDPREWFAELDRLGQGPFTPDGRLQPRNPPHGIVQR